MTITPDTPPHPPHDPDRPEPVDDFWTKPRPDPAGRGDGLAELAQELRHARLDAAIPHKADDADHLIDWPRVRRAATRLKHAAQLRPNMAAIGAALIAPAWLWRHVVEQCSTGFAPAADTADPGLCLSLMALAGVLVAGRRRPVGKGLRPIARLAAWSIVIGTLAHPPAAAWAAALAQGFGHWLIGLA
ncbi:hypothetical protein BX265_8367 [Streptomyces sp. TLI_235]|nr:hypothetical protein [Streptomyces sp. TLI_235]PBC66302.1 hypothetical protein BX265_8367 [Streptomyces sp. TLI_235]